MARNNWKAVAKTAETDYFIGVADTTGQDFDQDLGVRVSAVVAIGIAKAHLSISGQLQLSLFEGQRLASLVKDGDLVGLW